MQSKIIKKVKSFLSYSLKLFILTSFLLSQSFIAEIFLYQNNPNTKSINTAKADYNDHWYNTSWLYRKQITINHTNIPHTDTNNPNSYLSNFPVLVSTTIPTDKARSDHNDIVFANCDASACSVLSYEIESYDTANGNLTAWVKVPQLNDVNNTQDTSFYMYYGNSSHGTSDLENKTGVWDSDFKGVWHLGDTPSGHAAGDYKDSTVNVNNSTNTTNEPTATTLGQMDGAQSFNGTSSYIDVGNGSSLNITSDLTVEAWINPTVNNDWKQASIAIKYDSGTYQWKFGLNNVGQLRFDVFKNQTTSLQSTGGSIPINSWSHVVGKFISSTGTSLIYINGVLVHSENVLGPFTIQNINPNLKIGKDPVNSRNFSGFIDEVHVSDVARSADWIQTEYNNESNPNTFYTLGSEEDALPPVLTETIPILTPSNGSNLSYTFNSTKSGTISYGGSGCSSSTASVIAGNNTIIFNALLNGIHSDCTVEVIDGLGNHSNTLPVTSFTINTDINWYNSSWSYREQITIPHGNLLHTDTNNNNPYLVNFPILVSTNIPINKVRSDHNDIIFTNQGGTQLLNYEIESYDGTNGNLVAWVQLPQLNDINNTTDTSFYVYYGNSSHTTSNAASSSLWDSDFKMVQHMNQNAGGTAPQMEDSTINHNDGTSHGSMTSANQTTGQIDGAQSFNGTSQYVDAGSGASLNPANTITVDSWVKLNELNRNQFIITKRHISSPWYSYALFLLSSPSNKIYFSIYNQSGVQFTAISDQSPSLGVPYHIVGTLNSSGVVNLYINGVKQQNQSTLSGTILAGGSTLKIGTSNNEYLNGLIDEVRVSDTARSADWIKTEYNNQSSPSTFYNLGGEESCTSYTLPPVLTQVTPVPTPSNSATPYYTFFSTKPGIITYGGDCSSSTTLVVAGNNTINFNLLSAGMHSNCTIQTKDGLDNLSNILSISSFTINNVLTTYVVPAITDNKILPKSSIPSSYLLDTISTQVSSGEYKAASFVVNSNVGVSSLQVEVSDLIGSGNMISSASLDIKTVKCWYQGGYDNSGISVVGRYLTPELLLKDDSLVNISGDDWTYWSNPNSNGRNYLKVNGSYIDVSSGTQDVNDPDVVPISQRPVQDSTTLQPVNLPANYNKQFWITVHVPDNTPAGNYSGAINLKSGTQTIKSLNINIQVLPIDLPQPNVEYSLYYRGTINGNGSISSENKTVEQYTVEQQDMRAHGVTSPTIYSFGTDSNLLQELAIRQQAGMDNTNMYYVGSMATNNISYYRNLTAPYGVVNLYQYGPDEANLNDTAHRTTINNIHNAGGMYFDAQSSSQADSTADILDLAVVANNLLSTLAAKYHSYGHKIYSYANPQTVPEYPRTFRKNYGLALWQNDYDGVMDYAYQHSAGDIWNDFDNSMRDHVFAYPTMNGVIDTVQWEGFREGVNDMRYLAALQNAIAAADPNDTTVIEAKNYLANLKISNLVNQDLDVIRSRMINYILALASSSYSLTINYGTNSGFYKKDSKVTVIANTPQTGMVFNKWIGDTQYVDNINAASATVTMPSHVISLTATYTTSLWYSVNYPYRKAIIIDHNQVAGTDQSNFPVLISLTDSSLKSVISGGKVQNSNGYDVIFTLPDKTLLNYDIESYDNTTGKLVAWVKIPNLSHSTDTVLYLYYGNPNVTSSLENKTSVWNSDFKGVWHLKETATGATGDFKDSTANANDSTNSLLSSEPTPIAGQIDGAQSFNGINSNITVANSNSLTMGLSDFTISAWIYPTNVTGTWSSSKMIVDKKKEDTNDAGYYFRVSSSKLSLKIANGTTNFNKISNSTLSANTLYYVTAVANRSGNLIFYINGAQDVSYDMSSTSSWNLNSTDSLYFGNSQGITDFFNGTLDEVRISSVARSADWIKTEYNNQSFPSTFSTLSPEETILPPTITSLSANLPNGTYGTGTTIPITINFSKDVTSTGNITLTLNTTPERSCSFTITNNNSATCNYTIQGGDSATNLNATISGTIQDQFNNPLTNFTPLSNLSDNTTITIDTSSSPFTPPAKPNITTIQSAANSGINIDLQSIPSNITQIAISLTPDFKGVSWIDFDRKKFSTINQTTQTLYIKLRTNEGAVSDTIIITPQSSTNNPISLIDGDIIQCKSSNDPNAVYIVKITGNKTYIRHITSIQIFNYYKHLKWENLKQVDSLTPFSLSSWIRVNTNTNGLPKAGDKVYEINGDQSKHWINMTSSQFLTHGGSDEAIYTVNAGELNLYSAGADVVSL